ncbi:MAG: hypothetical protein AB7G21_13445, partial [Dehalococcoidia bacterium]
MVGSDATVVAADAAACALLGVRGPGELQGHAWTSFVIPSEEQPLAEARAATQAGRSWRGVLTFIGASSAYPIDVEIVPTEAAGGVALMHLHASAPLAILGRAPVDERVLLEAQVAALEAIAALPEATAASRGVLGALRGAVPFDWGAVLRFAGDPRSGPTGAEVVAVFPAAMAG